MKCDVVLISSKSQREKHDGKLHPCEDYIMCII